MSHFLQRVVLARGKKRMKGIYNVWGVKEFFLLAKFRSVTQQNKSLFQFQGIAESSNVKDINVCAKNPCCADLKFLKEVAVRMKSCFYLYFLSCSEFL